MKVLMVYENVPESTEIYIFDANEDEVNDLKLSHGNYTNANCDESIEKALSVFLSELVFQNIVMMIGFLIVER